MGSGEGGGLGGRLQVLVFSLFRAHGVCVLGTFSGSPLYCGLCGAGGAVILFFYFFCVAVFGFLFWFL